MKLSLPGGLTRPAYHAGKVGHVEPTPFKHGLFYFKLAGKMDHKTVVISDLDGTLLDPVTYSFEKALPLVKSLREQGVALVLCSSKTRAEIESYRDRLGNTDPFISENGGGIYIPDGYFPFATEGRLQGRYRVMALGMAYQEIRKAFTAARERAKARVRGFAEMSAPEITALTGLPLREAPLALEREFDEPFVFEGDENQIEFLESLVASGLKWTKGSVYHATGDNDKGKAVEILEALFIKAFGAVRTIGLGDGQNDFPMLRAVDVPVLVQKRDGGYEAGIDVPGLVLAPGIGPEGWVKALEAVLPRP